MGQIYSTKQHVVSEEYLKVLLARCGGVCHRYWIERITDHYCYVAYSNPDEYGNDCPVQLRYPVYRQRIGPRNQTTVCVVLDYIGCSGGRDSEDALPAADVTDEAILEWANTELFKADDGEWHTREELTQNGKVFDMPLGRGRAFEAHDLDNGQSPVMLEVDYD